MTQMQILGRNLVSKATHDMRRIVGCRLQRESTSFLQLPPAAGAGI